MAVKCIYNGLTVAPILVFLEADCCFTRFRGSLSVPKYSRFAVYFCGGCRWSGRIGMVGRGWGGMYVSTYYCGYYHSFAMVQKGLLMVRLSTAVVSELIRVVDCTAPPMQFTRNLPKFPSPPSTHFNLRVPVFRAGPGCGSVWWSVSLVHRCVEMIANRSNDPFRSPSVSRPSVCLTRFRMGVVFRVDPFASSSPVAPSQSTSAPPVLGLSLLPAALDPSSRWNLAMVPVRNHTQKDSGLTERPVMTLANCTC